MMAQLVNVSLLQQILIVNSIHDKISDPVENRMQHCCWGSIVTPGCRLIQAQQYCLILFTTRSDAAPNSIVASCLNNLVQLILVELGIEV